MKPVRWTMTRLLGRTTLAIAAAAIVGCSAVATAVPAAASPGVATAATYTWPKYGHDGANTGVSADPAISTANAQSSA